MKIRLLHRSLLGAALAVCAGAALAQPADQALLERGQYLTQTADCLACHVTDGGKPYAGGLPVKMPFGTLYSTNITPDKETGIGNWSDDDFVEAMQQGVSPDGKHYYPAFPYTSYTLMPREDILAIKAYLFSLEPVNQPNKENDIGFPFNQRWGIALWNMLFLDDERFEPDPEQSEQWNRGAYLVEGPGHCGECHTPRNFMQAKKASEALGGATIQGWAAWNITGDEQSGIGGWPDEALASYMATGVAPGYGVAGGPMAEVVNHSLRHLTPEDIQAIVVYLKSVPAQPAEVKRPDDKALANEPPSESRHPLGQKLFADACASCHHWDGSGRQSDYASLRGLRTVNDPNALNLVQVILNGDALHGPNGHHLMPAFNRHFNDREVSALSNFMLSHFGSQAGELTPETTAERRKEGH
ncbi:c-type cytochrome [Stutzerimonas zhaodongensis]|uniref:c-type cytochrome n=1 Tax=Stutzerimonas zhaodongensis TaxID=1176257 RepID=UPI002102C3A6|nr:cytochrome c [Stutzerimonas zhaodongensis]MCQ2030849.1 cytochrome c [Stutzerimonas zhaodongensis]